MSRADDVRRARETFELALAAGLTMEAARAEHAVAAGPRPMRGSPPAGCGTRVSDAPVAPPPADAPWMMRDLDQ